MGTVVPIATRARRLAQAGSALVAAVGLLVVAGWMLEYPAFTRLLPYGPTVKANTGLALASAGLANLLLITGAGWPSRWSGRLLGAVCLAIGAMTLSQHLAGWDLGIDQLLASEPPGAYATTSPNRMGPPGATALTLLGLALLLGDSRRQRRRAIGHGAALAGGTVAFLAVVVYAFGFTGLFDLARYTGIALATALALLMLSISIVAGRPAVGLGWLLCREDESGAMARHLFAAAVVLPFMMGWLFARAFSAGVVDGALAISAMTLLLMVGLTALIWRAGAELGRALDHRVAAQRTLEDTARALAEVDRQKSAFLATLSHELRNPLAPVRFALELLDGPPATASRAKQTISRQINHLVRLVDDLLDLTRITHNKLHLQRRDLEVKPVVMDAVDAVAQEISRAQHQLHVELPDDALWIHGDPERLVQVLSNLLTNAARYTPANGHITVGVRAEGSEVVFRVRDTGAGLTPADAERVFDMFVQVGNEGHGGLGIGLALVKGLAELHGGTVAVHSEGPGRGSEFVIRLPRVLHPVVPGDAPASPPRERPCTILVVDDNIDAVDTLRAMLELRGHRVAVAHTAADAFDLAVEMRPEIGLLDLGLPGTDGFALARRLRGEPTTARMLLVAITGWGQEEHRHKSQAAGFDAHLTKPADPEALVTLMAGRYPADGSAAAPPSS